jgi:hypothetical protein
MIVGGSEHKGSNRATFDDLFRRAGVRHADALALIDPPNCESVSGHSPRRLTFAQADRAISALAAKLHGLGLQTDTVVAIQLANTVDSVIAFLGVLRAGMIAAPLPLLWREQDMVAALGRISAKAIITSTHVGADAQSTSFAEIAMRVAAKLFPIRFVCGFGRELADGVVPLDDVFASAPGEFFQLAPRPRPATAHVAAITFDVTGDGFVPIVRSQSELIAGGVVAFLEGRLAADTTILSAIPIGSFAGIALTLVPWLLGGGTLALHHGFDPAAFAAQARVHDPLTVVLPGAALTPLADASVLDGQIKTILALWRAPEPLAAAARWRREATLVDIAGFRETMLLPARRGPDGMPAPVPPNAAPPPGITAVGFYRLRQREVHAAVAAVDPAAVIVALPDALLGQRLAGSARDSDAVATELQARGVNSLITGAFRTRGNAA